MKISMKVKRNLSFCLLLIGCVCITYRACQVAMAPHSGKAWFELVAMIIITWPCLDSFIDKYRKAKSETK